jgi:hypothetical protein
MVFHRFDHAAHYLYATLQCPAHRGKVLSAHQFFAVLIDTLNAPMHRIQSVLPNLQLTTAANFDITSLIQNLGNCLVNFTEYATFAYKLQFCTLNQIQEANYGNSSFNINYAI